MTWSPTLDELIDCDRSPIPDRCALCSSDCEKERLTLAGFELDLVVCCAVPQGELWLVDEGEVVGKILPAGEVAA